MGDFAKAIPIVLAHEGGSHFSDHPADRGGATRWGVTAATLGMARKLGRSATSEEVQALGYDEACAIYRDHYWTPCRCDAIASDRLATKLLDVAVNVGPRTAVRLLQRALGTCGVQIAQDGAMGPMTVAAANSRDPERVLRAFGRMQADHYLALAAADPSQRVFLAGWLIRSRWPGTSTSPEDERTA